MSIIVGMTELEEVEVYLCGDLVDQLITSSFRLQRATIGIFAILARYAT